MVNPYRTPVTALSDAPGSALLPRLKFAIWLPVYLYPVWLASSFYVTWIIAWIVLGHRPRPMLDDPKYIGGVMDLVCAIPLIMAMGFPLLTPLGFAASFICPIRICQRSRIRQITALSLIYIMLFVGALLLLRVDPG